jgi:hypothetical protein
MKKYFKLLVLLILILVINKGILTAECGLNEPMISDVKCIENATYEFTLNFAFQDTLTDSIEIYINELKFGKFSVNDLPLKIVQNKFSGNKTDKIKISDPSKPDCFVTTKVENPCSCAIFDFKYAKNKCTDTTFNIVFDFHHFETSDSFDIAVKNISFGRKSYKNLPVSIGPFSSADTIYNISVFDKVDSLCFNDFNVNGSECPDCFIRDIQLHGYECDANGNLFLKLSFLHTNVKTKKYVVTTNLGNEKIGEYKNNVIVDSVTFREYFVLGPVKSLCDTFLVITIWDLENKVCQSSLVLDSLCCEEKCIIEEISVKELKCNDDNTYQFYLNFTYKNSQSGKFYLNVNDQISGYFSVSQLPLLIKGVKLTDKKVHFIKVCLEDNCCKTREYEVPNCTGDDCIIEEIFIKEMKCNDDNTYQFYLNFTYKNSQSDSFYLSVNNQISGYYSINQLPLLVKGVKFTDKKVHFIKVCLEDNCCKTREYEVPNCTGDDCIIEEIFIKEMKCNDDNTYQFYLNFTYKNSQSDSFYLSVNNQISGYYSINQLPLLVKGVKFTDKKVHFIKVCLENNCCKAKEYEVPNCTGDGCIIEEIFIKEMKCTDNNTYQFYLNFTYKNSQSDSFYLSVNNQISGYYSINQLPLLVKGVKFTDKKVHFIKVCLENNCCKAKEYEVPNCTGDGCKIYNISYRPIFDTLNGRFWIMLDFKHLNTSESFYLKGNGKNYGVFNYNELPIFLGPYICKENLPIEYIISDSKNEVCHEVIEAGVISCPSLSETEMIEDSGWYIFSSAEQGIVEIISGIDQTRDASVEIFNLMGQKIAGHKISDGSKIYELDINHIQTGIYFVKFRTGGKIYTKKIFIGKGR